MRILLDENIPRKLKRLFDKSFVVMTVPQRGWNGKKNGDLLQLADPEFDVFVTMDKGIQYQQNLKNFNIAIILLVAKSNKYDTLAPLMPKVNEALKHIRPKLTICSWFEKQDWSCLEPTQ